MKLGAANKNDMTEDEVSTQQKYTVLDTKPKPRPTRKVTFEDAKHDKEEIEEST